MGGKNGRAGHCLAPPSPADDLVKAGTVKIEQVQIAFIGSGNLGGGTLDPVADAAGPFQRF
jgi:hypothetical protein